VMENRNGMVVATEMTPATGTAGDRPKHGGDQAAMRNERRRRRMLP